MEDMYVSHSGRLKEYQERLGYVEGATGLAVAIGPKVVAIDLFDKPSTCRKTWDRLLSGLVMDALEEGEDSQQPPAGAVDAFLKALESAPWQETPAVGVGQEFRSDLVPATHASALMFEDCVLHGSAVVGGAD